MQIEVEGAQTLQHSTYRTFNKWELVPLIPVTDHFLSVSLACPFSPNVSSHFLTHPWRYSSGAAPSSASSYSEPPPYIVRLFLKHITSVVWSGSGRCNTSTSHSVQADTVLLSSWCDGTRRRKVLREEHSQRTAGLHWYNMMDAGMPWTQLFLFNYKQKSFPASAEVILVFCWITLWELISEVGLLFERLHDANSTTLVSKMLPVHAV